MGSRLAEGGGGIHVRLLDCSRLVENNEVAVRKFRNVVSLAFAKEEKEREVNKDFSSSKDIRKIITGLAMKIATRGLKLIKV